MTMQELRTLPPSLKVLFRGKEYVGHVRTKYVAVPDVMFKVGPNKPFLAFAFSWESILESVNSKTPLVVE